jgi:uncharacterized damage-inducible protein DinB
MNDEHLYVFQDLEGFTPHISRLVCMMDFARQETLESVRGLTQKQLDTLISPDGNTIAMLLAHIANLEHWWQSHTFEGNKTFWNNPASVLGEIGRQHIHSHKLDYYLDELKTVRQKTLEKFATYDDVWLHKTSPFFSHSKPMNNYFKWFHVLEDEINHRGQIRLMRRIIENQK